MSDEIWKRAEIESPCIKLCVVHPETRLCVGCFRSIDEIGSWSKKTSEERQAIMAELPARSSQLIKRRGGRMGRLTAGNDIQALPLPDQTGAIQPATDDIKGRK